MIPETSKIYLKTGPTDMRKSIDGLAIMVVDLLKQDPQSGHLFLFRNRSGNNKRVATSVKMLGHPSLQHPLANATTNRPRPSPSLALRPLRGLRTSSQMTLRRLKIF